MSLRDSIEKCIHNDMCLIIAVLAILLLLCIIILIVLKSKGRFNDLAYDNQWNTDRIADVEKLVIEQKDVLKEVQVAIDIIIADVEDRKEHKFGDNLDKIYTSIESDIKEYKDTKNDPFRDVANFKSYLHVKYAKINKLANKLINEDLTEQKLKDIKNIVEKERNLIEKSTAKNLLSENFINKTTDENKLQIDKLFFDLLEIVLSPTNNKKERIRTVIQNYVFKTLWYTVNTWNRAVKEDEEKNEESANSFEKLIEKGKIREAIKLLIQIDEIKDTALLILSRYNDFEFKEMRGTISNEDRNIERSNIIKALINLKNIH